MARRDLTNFRTVINQVPDIASVLENIEEPNIFLNAGIDFATTILRQGQEAKITENMSNAQLDLNALQNQYQIDFERDPMGGLKEYKASRKDIFNRYGDEISPLFRNQWNDNVRNIELRNDATQQAWAFQQTRTNTINSINSSMKNNFIQAGFDGKRFGDADATEIEAFVNFATSAQQLSEFGNKNLGEVTTESIMDTYEQDYIKSFVSGLIETNPIKAHNLLSSETFEGQLDSKELSILKRAAKNKVLNFDKVREEQAILSVMSGEDDLYRQSLERDLSIAELEHAFRVNKTPKSVQSVLLKMNGYGAKAEKTLRDPKKVKKTLSNSEKVRNQVNMFNKLALIGRQDELTSSDLNDFRINIYELIDNGSLTKEQGVKALNQLVEPSIVLLEENLKTYQRGDRNPFITDIGFSGIQEAFVKNFEIDEEDSFLSKKQLNDRNNANQLSLYRAYQDALIEFTPAGVAMADIPRLPSKKRNQIYKDAQAKALSDFAFRATGYISKDTDTSQDIINVIQGIEEQKVKETANTIIDNAYETQPVSFGITFDTVEDLNAANLPIGTIVIVGGVRGEVE